MPSNDTKTIDPLILNQGEGSHDVPFQLGSVAAIRQTIDEIDNQLIALLSKRMACSQAMGAAKRAEEEAAKATQSADAASEKIASDDIVFRPAREAQVLQRVLHRARGVSPMLVYRVWRQIFSASCQVQQPFLIGFLPHATQEQALLHFGAMGSFHDFSSAESMLQAIAKRKIDLAVLPWGPNEDWWQGLPDLGLYISATVPTVLGAYQEPHAVVVTRHASDAPNVSDTSDHDENAGPRLRVLSLFCEHGQLVRRKGYTAPKADSALVGHLIEVITA